jgi:hypothetical protein
VVCLDKIQQNSCIFKRKENIRLTPAHFLCRKYHVLFTYLFVFIYAWWSPTQIDCMCNMAGGCLIRNRNCFSFANTWVHVLCVILVVFVFVIFLVYQVLSFSLDCPFLITPSVFSNVYVFCVAFVRLLPVSCVASVARVSGLPILDCHFRFRFVVLDLVMCMFCRSLFVLLYIFA